MTEPLKLSRWCAHERRSEFDAKAMALASAAGLPTRPYKKTGFPLPAWASFYADDRALAVLVCTGEQWRTVEKGTGVRGCPRSGPEARARHAGILAG